MFPLTISFPDFPPSEAVRESVEDRARKLEQIYGRIIDCRVVIQSPHQHKWKGRIYHVQIHLNVPGQELIVSREPEKNSAHEDVYLAIRDAFNAMRRQLKAWSSKQKDHHHATSQRGA